MREAAQLKPSAANFTLDDATYAEIVRRVPSTVRAARVIVFGSAAAGRMTRDSDVDLLVLTDDDGDARARAVAIRAALIGMPYPFDIVVMSRRRFAETRDTIGGLAWPAARSGKIIYEAA